MSRTLAFWTVAVSSSLAAIAAASALATRAPSAPVGGGGKLLDNFDKSLTDYLRSANDTLLQKVRPAVSARAVTPQGALRSPIPHRMALAANPSGDSSGGVARINDVDLATGAWSPLVVDLELEAPGVNWPIGRSFGQQQVDNTPSHIDSDGYQGKNWFQSSQLEIGLYQDNPGTKEADDHVYLYLGADRFAEFQRVDISSDDFVAGQGAAGGFDFTAASGGEPELYTYIDQRGTEFVFFGFDSNGADGQLWKITDADGNTAFVGDATTASTAISNGYSSGKIATAYDSADRRYTYTYTSGRLTEVKAETKSGGTWASPTGVETAGKVEYAYYSSESYGDDGNLKLVTMTTPLTDSGVDLVRKRYYRYWEGAFNASTNPGHANLVKLVVDAEGLRRFDLDEVGAGEPELDDGFLTASHESLKAYASSYFEYDSQHRIVEAWFNGECGCSGAGAGTYRYEYETNGSYSDGAGYDEEWKTRTIVEQPDGTYLTQYFDEAGQTLHSVTTDGDPDNTSPAPNQWITKVVRDAEGRVTKVHTPANITGYTHSTAAITTSTSEGVIWVYDLFDSGLLEGLVEHRKYQEGTSGTEYYLETVDYDTQIETTGDVAVVRPFMTGRRVYHTASSTEDSTKYDETTWAYTFYTGTLQAKTVTATYPVVTTAKYGSNAADSDSAYYDEAGRTTFVKSTDGIISYVEYDAEGHVSKRISDADTSQNGVGEDFYGVTIPTGFSSSGTPLPSVATYAYDERGHGMEATAPDGLVTKSYQSKLADGRAVSLSYPRYVTTPSTKFYGPVSFSVQNLAGKTEAQGLIALTGNESAVSLASHVDETDSDPITAIDGLGTLCRLTTSIYSETGSTLQESRLYFDIPASGVGTDGTNYDPTLFGYDDMGRRVRVKEASGTISRSVYDSAGRQVAQWTGTNDSTFAGGESSGTDDMVKVSEVEFDGGSDDGNGLVTKRTLFVEGSTTGKRETTYQHDLFGRVLLQTNPTAPHTLNAYDLRGRTTATAQYSSTASIVVGTDVPTTEATNRLTLNETFYNQKGQVYKRGRHAIDQDDGSDDATMSSLYWYDSAGRNIKEKSDQLTKREYDRLGRTTREFVLANTDDTTYAEADDVSGDIVLEERRTGYDDVSRAILSIQIDRLHDDRSTGTSGALDTNADSDDLLFTAANNNGRAQIMGMWYDAQGRIEDSVSFGTYGGSNFDRDGMSVPARSDTALRTNYSYGIDGQVEIVTDPMEHDSKTERDDAGRVVAEIRNYDGAVNSGLPSGSDDNVTVRYAYTDGMRVSITADMPSGQDDQVTTYTYGTTKGVSAGDSKVGSGHMLQKVQYPDSAGGTDVVTHAYNAQGQPIYKKDQAGNVFEYVYDDSGRQLHMRLSTIDADFDDEVERVSATFDGLGRRSTVAQWDDDAVGSGNVIDEVKFTYTDWGEVHKFRQDLNSAVDASGSVDDYEVEYTYAATNANRNSIYLTRMDYPSSTYIGLQYRATDGLLDLDYLRPTILGVNGTMTVVYYYNGTGQAVSTDYLGPDIKWEKFGSTSGSFPDLDRFNRVTSSRWTAYHGTATDFYDIDISYDRNSNITLIEDNVHSGFDVSYTMDDVDRLTRAQEGTWGGSSISSETRDQEWTLDHVGNWDLAKLDLNGDGDWSDADEYEDDRTHNKVNELTGRDTDDSGSDDYTLAYDEVGNLVDDGESYKYVYDPMGRLREVLARSDDSLVAEYKYNGLRYRVSEHLDTDDDGDVDGSDDWWHYAFDTRWRVISKYVGSASDPEEEFVHQRAGRDGRGGSSYIDELALRDRDTTGNGTLDERIYYCQNWRADVSALVDDAGAIVEWVKYSAYGVPVGLPGGDTDSDGDCDSTDEAQAATWLAGAVYDARGDVDLDGDVDTVDESEIAGARAGAQTGWEELSLSGVNSKRGWGGYTLEAGGRSRYTVRWRRIRSGLGRWLAPDPAAYLDGMNLFEYVISSPIVHLDPLGLGSLRVKSGSKADVWAVGKDKVRTPVGEGRFWVYSTSMDMLGGRTIGVGGYWHTYTRYEVTDGPSGMVPVAPGEESPWDDTDNVVICCDDDCGYYRIRGPMSGEADCVDGKPVLDLDYWPLPAAPQKRGNREQLKAWAESNGYSMD